MASDALVLAAVAVGALCGPVQAGLADAAAQRRWPPRWRVRPRALGLALVTAIVFGALVARLAERPAVLPAYLYVAAVGAVLAVVDVAEHRLPNVVVLPSYGVLAGLVGLAAAVEHDGTAAVRAGLGGAALFGALLLLALAQPAAMGFGDVKLAGLLGIALGYLSWDAVLGGIAAAFVLGGVAGVVVLATRRGGLHSELAFGPFLVSGALIAVLLAGP